MIDQEFLAALDQFHLIIRKRVTSSYTGSRASMSGGRGLTLKDYRIYSPGDDFRMIDWKIYARTDDLYIKRYEEEKNLTLHVIVDASKSMDFGTTVKKLDYASMLAVGFAYLSMKENEKFLISTFAKDLHMFPVGRGMSHLLYLIEHLNTLQTERKSNFFDVMTKYKKMLKSRSMIILISDFLFDPADVQSGILSVGNHDLKVIQVLDETEKYPEMLGDQKLRDSENYNQLRVYMGPRLITEYEERLNSHTQAIEEVCTKIGAKFFSFSTKQSIFDAFFKVLT